MKLRKIVAIIGDSECVTAEECKFAEKLGYEIAKNNWVLLTGGRGGVMEAAFKGSDRNGGLNLAIIPSSDKSEANKYSHIVVATGVGWTRNSFVALTADVIVAIGGKSGTLSEIAYAWMYNKPIIGVKGFGGWSEKLAGKKIDDRRDDFIIPCDTTECVVETIRNILDQKF